MSTIENEERTITAVPGEEVVLSAPREGIGGYSWNLEIDPDIGELVARESVGGEGAIGGGATARFRVRMTGREGHARLILRRSWEAQPAETVELLIKKGG